MPKFESLDGVKQIKNIAVRFNLLHYDQSTDVRDRNDPAQIEYENNLLHEVIVPQGGIQTTLEGFKNFVDGRQVISIINGRTRYRCLLRAMKEGLISESAVENSWIKVELIANSNEYDRMQRQLTAQYIKPLSCIEQLRGIKKMLSLNGGDEESIRVALGKTKAQFKAILAAAILPPNVQVMVQSKELALSTAISFWEKSNGSDAEKSAQLEKLAKSNKQNAAEINENKNSGARKSQKTSKRDSENMLYEQLSKNKQKGLKIEAIATLKELIYEIESDNCDGFEINAAISFGHKIFNRISRDEKARALIRAAGR